MRCMTFSGPSFAWACRLRRLSLRHEVCPPRMARLHAAVAGAAQSPPPIPSDRPAHPGAKRARRGGRHGGISMRIRVVLTFLLLFTTLDMARAEPTVRESLRQKMNE